MRAPTRAMNSSTSCLLQLVVERLGHQLSRWPGRPARATSACTSLCSRPWTDSTSLVGLGPQLGDLLLQAGPAVARAGGRPARPRRPAAAGARRRCRPWPGRIDAAASSASAFAVAASSSCAWMRAVRAAIICLACGQRELPQQEGDDEERQRPPDELGRLREDPAGGSWSGPPGGQETDRTEGGGHGHQLTSALMAPSTAARAAAGSTGSTEHPLGGQRRRPARPASTTCVAGRGLRRLGLGGRRGPVVPRPRR